ncbi:MAG: helix-turn-helix transcriptional regulator [Eubacteriales bacterium]|nr:helix-turn-helix transcriptional regulator [Eubacteriales bacterium]
MHDLVLRDNLKTNLIFLRKGNKMTQQQVADLLGIERSTYTSWESGRSLPKPAQFIKLSKIFDVSFEFLTQSPLERPLIVKAKEKPYDRKVYGDSYVSELNDYERTIVLQLRMMNASDKKNVEEYIQSIISNSNEQAQG